MIPSGFLPCDGSAVSRITYANLFTAIGVTHGYGDQSTTFNVPDYRGRFLRGTDAQGVGAANRDHDATLRTAMQIGGNLGNAVGSIQSQATAKNGIALSDPGHEHTLYLEGGIANAGPYSAAWRTTAPPNPLIAVTGGGQGISASTTGVSLTTGDAETRPINAYINFIIKT